MPAGDRVYRAPDLKRGRPPAVAPRHPTGRQEQEHQYPPAPDQVHHPPPTFSREQKSERRRASSENCRESLIHNSGQVLAHVPEPCSDLLVKHRRSRRYEHRFSTGFTGSVRSVVIAAVDLPAGSR